MIHEQRLVDKLSGLPIERFDGEVYRTTSVAADPIAPSTNGGRWAPPQGNTTEVSVLYTSLERNGALAEVVSYLTLLTPMPKARNLKVSRLGVSTSKTLRLAKTALVDLGVETHRYGERDYARTQQIGAALSFLELDGLIAPSARWPCDNLMIFSANHAFSERLEVIDAEEVEWRQWAIDYGLLGKSEA